VVESQNSAKPACISARTTLVGRVYLIVINDNVPKKPTAIALSQRVKKEGSLLA
jgi:hypothetical protein